MEKAKCIKRRNKEGEATAQNGGRKKCKKMNKKTRWKEKTGEVYEHNLDLKKERRKRGKRRRKKWSEVVQGKDKGNRRKI